MEHSQENNDCQYIVAKANSGSFPQSKTCRILNCQSVIFIFTQLWMLMQRDTFGLNAENKELKLRLQALEQQAHLRDGMCLYK